MKSYSKAPDDVTTRVAHLIKLFRSDLLDAGLRIDLLSVADEDGESCLMHQGYPAAAVVRIVDSKGRTMGRGDAEIVFDEPSYMKLSDPERDALIDHELYHVELRTGVNKKTQEEYVKLDENGRPKLRLRKHDVSVGWFAEIAERHGAASMERKQALSIYMAGQQTFFAFDSAQHIAIAEANVKQIEEKHESSGSAEAVAKYHARKMVADMRKKGVTMTMTSGGETVEIK